MEPFISKHFLKIKAKTPEILGLRNISYVCTCLQTAILMLLGICILV